MQLDFRQHLIAVFFMAAFTFVMLSVSLYVPFVGVLLAAVSGIPGVFAILAWGNAWFALYAAFVVAGIGLASGWDVAFILIPLLIVPISLLAFCIKLELAPLRAVATSLVVSMAVAVCLWSVAPLFGEIGVKLWRLRSAFERQAALMELQLRKAASQNLSNEKAKALETSDVQPVERNTTGESNFATGNSLSIVPADETTEVLFQRFREWMEFVALLVPITFLFSWYFFALIVMYCGVEIAAPKYALKVTPLPPFSTWRFDWRLIWFFIGGWFLYAFAYVIPQPVLRRLVELVGANCLAISNILYFIAGFSLLFYFFEKNSIGFISRICISVLAFMMAQMLVWLGIADVWLDFRAPPKVNQNDDTSSFFDSF